MFTIVDILPITEQVRLVRKKVFIATTMKPDDKISLVHVAVFANFNSNADLFCKVQIVLLIQNKTLILILVKYTDFIKVFSSHFVGKLLKHNKINNHFINSFNS